MVAPCTAYAPTHKHGFVPFSHVATMLCVLMDAGLSSAAIASNALTSEGGNDTLETTVGLQMPIRLYCSSPCTVAVVHKSTATTR